MHAQRGQAVCRMEPRLPSPPKALPEICLPHATESERASSCYLIHNVTPGVEAGQGPVILTICSMPKVLELA